LIHDEEEIFESKQMKVEEIPSVDQQLVKKMHFLIFFRF